MSAEILWRRYSPADKEAVLALKREQDEVLGRKVDFNELTEHPVLVAEVAEIGREIVGLHTLESVPEYCMFSRDPRFTAAAARRAPEICGLLKSHGFRIVRCMVPDWLGNDEKTIVEALRATGFQFDCEPGKDYARLMLDLRR
jgi:hypothetical protein